MPIGSKGPFCCSEIDTKCQRYALCQEPPEQENTSSPGHLWISVDIFQILPGSRVMAVPTDLTGTPTKRHRPAPLSCWPKTHAVLCQGKHDSNETL